MKTIFKNSKYHFSFKTAALDDVENVLKILDISKSCHVSDIAPKILKENSTSSLTFYVQMNKFYFENSFWKVKPKY